MDTSEVQKYLEALSPERKDAMLKLRQILQSNLPNGFMETLQYKMLSYVVPHSIYPKGYHCKPSDALPFISIASQKNFISIHHMGIYTNPALFKWFVEAYPKYSTSKLDMGKGCIRFKKPTDIPFELIGKLVTKMSVKDWIDLYESHLKK